jgi:hypothetical protein
MTQGNDILKITAEEQLSGIPTPDFLDIILSNTELSDIAMYYLLQKRINHKLRMRYDVYENQLTDDFDDITGDFFIYLRDGNDKNNTLPYQSLHNIKKKESFEAWIKNTFRNYLSNKIQTEGRIEQDNCAQKLDVYKIDASPLTNETNLYIASQLISYTHQVLSPRGRFIFLRILLSLLNRQKAMSDKDTAIAIGMNYQSYRVTVHRIKDSLIKHRACLLQGEMLNLDDQHRQMAQHIYDDFTNLYQILIIYYNYSIEHLEYKDEIKALRDRYYNLTGYMAHEPASQYIPARITPKIFLERLNGLLNGESEQLKTTYYEHSKNSSAAAYRLPWQRQNHSSKPHTFKQQRHTLCSDCQ